MTTRTDRRYAASPPYRPARPPGRSRPAPPASGRRAQLDPRSRQSRVARLDARKTAARRSARRRRRLIVCTLLVLAVVLVGVDFLRKRTFTDPRPASAGARPPATAVAGAQPPPSGRPSALPSVTGAPSQATGPAVPDTGAGTYDTAPGQTQVFGHSGSLLRYKVAVEQGLGEAAVPPADFAALIDETLADERSWIASGQWRLQRVSSGPFDFTVYLAAPKTVERLCPSVGTDGYTSCREGNNVAINLARWWGAVPEYKGTDIKIYRQYAINHEVGHRLGKNHELCPGAGQPAPVMQQQTLKLAGCKPNSWPYLDGKAYNGPPGSYG